MQNKSSTKKSLLFSAFSLFLSLVLLAGTTFAWFTDSASTSVNAIHSGTLDITLEDPEGNPLEGQPLSFLRMTNNGIIPADETLLWEPGAEFETESFYVVNKGNLAVKYKIILNKPDGDQKLLEVIDWAIRIGNEEFAAFPGSYLNAENTEYAGHLSPEGYSEEITIVARMRETAGNDYQNLMLTGITFTVLATQDTVEYDSFNKTYDAAAEFDISVPPVETQDPIDPVVDPDPQEPGTGTDEIYTVYFEGVSYVVDENGDVLAYWDSNMLEWIFVDSADYPNLSAYIPDSGNQPVIGGGDLSWELDL